MLVQAGTSTFFMEEELFLPKDLYIGIEYCHAEEVELFW